jgi:type IV pilus assembly protein PilM
MQKKSTMAFSGFSVKPKRREQIAAIDLGACSTKAVHLQRRGEGYALLGFTVQPTPRAETGLSREALAGHLRKVMQALGGRARQVVLAMDVGESLMRNTEMPLVPVSDMRTMLQLNPKSYLQQDLQDYVFDCVALPPKALPPGPEAGKMPAKCKVIVGGVRRQYLEELQAAARLAGLTLEMVAPNPIGPPNALELAQPDIFQKEVVAMVDLGFRHSSINILQCGELMLNRVVDLGGDKLTASLADMMNISYAEAEGIKVGMPRDVETTLQPLLAPIGRELRASIDFYEHQQDKTVTQVLVSGAAARSEFVLQVLQTELMVPCKNWNPAGVLELELALSAQQRMEFEQASVDLAVAIGVALSAF